MRLPQLASQRDAGIFYLAYVVTFSITKLEIA